MKEQLLNYMFAPLKAMFINMHFNASKQNKNIH